MNKAFLTAVALAATGCGHAAYASHFADETVGHVGCPREEMVASDWDSDIVTGKQTWRVRCRGHEFFCQTLNGGGYGSMDVQSHGTSCTEAMPMLPVANQ